MGMILKTKHEKCQFYWLHGEVLLRTVKERKQQFYDSGKIHGSNLEVNFTFPFSLLLMGKSCHAL